MLKRLAPKSLFGRAIIIVVAPVVLLQIVAAIVFYDRHLDQITRRLARSVSGDIGFVAGQLRWFLCVPSWLPTHVQPPAPACLLSCTGLSVLPSL